MRLIFFWISLVFSFLISGISSYFLPIKIISFSVENSYENEIDIMGVKQ